MSGRQPQILFIDAYDSYANNIIALVKQRTGAAITVIHHDDPTLLSTNDKRWAKYLGGFDAVIAGPGPGSAENYDDIGLIARLWNVDASWQVPVLGICLGFQSLGVAYGAEIRRLDVPNHGTVVKMITSSPQLFDAAAELGVVQYNSLYVDIQADFCNFTKTAWIPSGKCPQLRPLGWRISDSGFEPVVFAIQHVSKPFWGVQYHPESICTGPEGASIIDSWWNMAVKHNTERSQNQPPGVQQYFELTGVTDKYFSHHTEIRVCPDDRPRSPSEPSNGASSDQEPLDLGIPLNATRTVHWLEIALHGHTVSSIRNSFPPQNQSILLESGTNPNGDPVRPETGRFSIIGIEYGTELLTVTYKTSKKRTSISYRKSCTTSEASVDIWTTLETIMRDAKTDGGCSKIPFWGGLVGFISYEGCLPGIGVEPSSTNGTKPDLCFTFVHRSIVVDHVAKNIYVQTIAPEDDAWLVAATSKLRSRIIEPVGLQSSALSHNHHAVVTQEDTASEYRSKIVQTQKHIAAGSSYELCLTTQTRLSLATSASSTPSSLYDRLRTSNPAPFAAHLSLPIFVGDGQTPRPVTRVTVLSSSPERFLSFSRSGTCQFRPIKGTVHKTPTTTRADAEAILRSPKEQAENLMIVDLIRHDLHGVVGAGNVTVPKLMGIEEYEKVYQLVSVIEGRLEPDAAPLRTDVGSRNKRSEKKKTGIDVLKASLPPGSMIGAPKKRSCELLQQLEDHEPRGIYSGVLGYLDVGGGGDFSVVIRSAVNWTCDNSADERSHWTIGAGGAITSQSSPQAEWEEMRGKRDTLLDVFLGRDKAYTHDADHTKAETGTIPRISTKDSRDRLAADLFNLHGIDLDERQASRVADAGPKSWHNLDAHLVSSVAVACDGGSSNASNVQLPDHHADKVILGHHGYNIHSHVAANVNGTSSEDVWSTASQCPDDSDEERNAAFTID